MSERSEGEDAVVGRSVDDAAGVVAEVEGVTVVVPEVGKEVEVRTGRRGARDGRVLEADAAMMDGLRTEAPRRAAMVDEEGVERSYMMIVVRTYMSRMKGGLRSRTWRMPREVCLLPGMERDQESNGPGRIRVESRERGSPPTRREKPVWCQDSARRILPYC